jgi:PAS domain S-box-containing protein
MRSLFWKVFFATLLTLLVALATVSLLLTATIENFYTERAELHMGHLAKGMAQRLKPFVSDPVDEKELVRVLRLMEASSGTQICLIGRSGPAARTFGEGPGGGEQRPGPGAAELEPGDAAVVPGGEVLCGERMLNAQWNFEDENGGIWSLYVRASLFGVVDEIVYQLRRLVLLAVLIAVAVSLVTALALSRRIANPLRGIRGLVGEMAAGDFSRRLSIDEPTEVRDLAHSFNSLADSLQTTLGELEREQARLRGILASVAEGIIAVDTEGRIALVNPQAAELLGVAQREVIGSPVHDLPLPENIMRLFSECLGTTQLCNAEFELEQTHRQLLLQVAPVRSGEEGGWGAVAVLRDVTGERRLDHMRRQFISDASHEIRTPLTAIGGFASAIADGTATTPEERTRSAALIVREVERLTRLVNELLNLSRIESGAAKLQLEEVELLDLVQAAVESFSKQAADRDVRVELDLARGLPRVRVDADRIYQVMVNLLSNALRFNRPEGEIAVSARREDGLVRVAVRDSGPGIPADQLSRIWERFHRADSSRARQDGGTGLGLAIVRSIVEAHGGSVSAESEIGEGSTFSFTVPIA